jgi:hypothetical protein
MNGQKDSDPDFSIELCAITREVKDSYPGLHFAFSAAKEYIPSIAK